MIYDAIQSASNSGWIGVEAFPQYWKLSHDLDSRPEGEILAGTDLTEVTPVQAEPKTDPS